MTDVRIVVLGAGFGGVKATLQIAKKLPNVQIQLVNKTSFHCYFPDVYEVATAALECQGKIKPDDLAGTVNIPLQAIFADYKNVTLIQDEVLAVDLTTKAVTTSTQTLSYDYLVLGLGSKTNFFGIPGAEKHAHALKTTEDALQIRNDLEQKFCRSATPFQVVVAGGGFTGVEVAGEMIGFLKAHGGKVVLVEALLDILTGMPEWSQKEAANRLSKIGVEVLTNYQITKIEAAMIYCKNGQQVPFDYLIWTTGIEGQTLGGQIKGAEYSKKGQLRVDANLHLTQHPEVFVVGDLAEVIDQAKARPVPPAAWAAVGEGLTAGNNIVAMVKNQPLSTYNPPYPSFVVPVGGRYALTNALGLEMTGLLVWIVKQFIQLHYLLSILSPLSALTLWWKGVSVFTRSGEKVASATSVS